MENVGTGEEVIVPLDQLRPGQWAEVVAIRSAAAARLLKLSAFGLAPGSLIRLQQRSPAYVVWVGETQLSLEAEVAREVLTRVVTGLATNV